MIPPKEFNDSESAALVLRHLGVGENGIADIFSLKGERPGYPTITLDDFNGRVAEKFGEPFPLWAVDEEGLRARRVTFMTNDGELLLESVRWRPDPPHVFKFSCCRRGQRFDLTLAEVWQEIESYVPPRRFRRLMRCLHLPV